ncbi:MAG: hypothetical protein CM1200mP20_09360 [Pseudomonadota bacterium]|nr:MAG: hypothetical protein CM1200mP20_09360 [Pseudomonadota bacterium]
MAPPTQGECTGAVGFKITKGECDGVALDGLIVVATFYFPRAIHHGDGTCSPYGASASEAQRDALFYILAGEDQPVGTMFQIFSVIMIITTTRFSRDRVGWDIKARRGQIDVPGVVRTEAKPILNPVTEPSSGSSPPCPMAGCSMKQKARTVRPKESVTSSSTSPLAQLTGICRLGPERSESGPQ